MSKRKFVGPLLELISGVEFLEFVPPFMRDLLRALSRDVHGPAGVRDGLEEYTVCRRDVLQAARGNDRLSCLVNRLETEFPEQWRRRVRWSGNELKDSVISCIQTGNPEQAKAILSNPHAPQVEWDNDDGMFRLFVGMTASDIFNTMADLGIVMSCHTHFGNMSTDKVEHARDRYEHELVLLLQERALPAEDCCELVVSFLTPTRWERHAELHRNGHYMTAPSAGLSGCDPCPYGFS